MWHARFGGFDNSGECSNILFSERVEYFEKVVIIVKGAQSAGGMADTQLSSFYAQQHTSCGMADENDYNLMLRYVIMFTFVV